MVGFKALCPRFKTSSLKWDHVSFVEMNQYPNLTPKEETICRRYRKLSCVHGLVEKIEPKPRLSPLPPFVGLWAVPWGSSAKARGWAGLYKPTSPWQLGSNRVSRLLLSLQHQNLSEGWRTYLEQIQGWFRMLGWSLSLLAYFFPVHLLSVLAVCSNSSSSCLSWLEE